MSWSESFAPRVDEHCQVLILGSMPGVKSLADDEYYAHPRNAFWPIMQALVDIDRQLPYLQRLMLLNGSGIGLWDVYQRCYRPGSLDANIDKNTSELNDFITLFKQYRNLRHIFFNGKAAEAAFRKHIIPALSASSLSTEVFSFSVLPSTSPANASQSFDEKLQQWRAIVEVHKQCSIGSDK